LAIKKGVHSHSRHLFAKIKIISHIISSSFILSLYTILSDKFWRKGKLSSKEKKGFLSKKSAR
jgi:hypothetical protein